MVWDVFCRVIDNHGDLGVCWRLACDLGSRGHAVRLWVDDPRALAWMAPGVTVESMADPTPPAIGRVQVLPWPNPGDPLPEPGRVVIEAFGCDPPADFVAAMAARPARGGTAPTWINLEYLSAEAYVERSHGLPSPQSHGPGAGLVKHFFFPGFTSRTGGLLREPALAARQGVFDAAAWLAARGVVLGPGERAVSLFCYPGAPVAALLDRLSDQPTCVLACPGAATEAVLRLFGSVPEAGSAGAAPGRDTDGAKPGSASGRVGRPDVGRGIRRGPVRAVLLPWLTQDDYDHLLWSCTLNLVRGEDSAVRAQWAGRPFLWQLYPQDDGAHLAKLDAFLDRFLGNDGSAPLSPWERAGVRAGSSHPSPPGPHRPIPLSNGERATVRPASPEPAPGAALRTLWHAWNHPKESAGSPAPLPAFPDSTAWAALAAGWRHHLLAQDDLVTRLLAFVQATAAPSG
jgi:hypothetical protein